MLETEKSTPLEEFKWSAVDDMKIWQLCNNHGQSDRSL
jgi:hypothetical protein